MNARPMTLLLLAGCAGEPELHFEDPDPWPSKDLVPEAGGPRWAITNSADDTLSLVDVATAQEIARVPLGANPLEREGPHHLQASADGRFLYVGISNVVPLGSNEQGPHGSHGTGTADGYLLQIDAATGHERARTRVDRSPGDVRFDPARRFVWQSHFDLAGALAAIREGRPRAEQDSNLVGTNPETMRREVQIRACPAGHGIGFSPDGALAYVACWFSDELAVLDLAGASPRARVLLGPLASPPPAPRYQPYALAVSPADGRVWVSATGAGVKGLYAYDPRLEDMDPAAQLLTSGAPQFGSFTADGARYYVVTQKPDHLLIFDPATLAVRRDQELESYGCLNAHAVRLTPDERQAWVLCEGDHYGVPGKLLALDAATLAKQSETTLGLFPDDLEWLPAPGGAP